jgi:hypothetical protein
MLNQQQKTIILINDEKCRKVGIGGVLENSLQGIKKVIIVSFKQVFY